MEDYTLEKQHLYSMEVEHELFISSKLLIMSFQSFLNCSLRILRDQDRIVPELW